MKKLVISTTLLCALTSASYFANAADGTITFNGTITAQTCTVNGNGSANSSFTVTLPTVSSSSLATAGQTAGRTPFNIALTGCTPDTGNVHTYFEPGPTVNNTTGRLIVNSGGATNVEIGVLNDDYTVVSLGAADASQNSKAVPIAAGSATLNYYAQYVATGAASAGAASSSVLYTLAYQ